MLTLLERHFPEAEVKLWASKDMSVPVAAMLHRRFPMLEIVQGTLSEQGEASNKELLDALQWSDFLLHGSGPSLVAAKDVAAYIKVTGKPYGVYGITHGSFFSGADAELLSQARFVFFRDSVSLEVAKQQNISSPIMEFAPDAAFAFDIRNDTTAAEFLKANALDEQKFFCCLSRLRYTPYWEIPGSDRAFDPKRHARNEEMKEHDHAPLRAAITRIVRELKQKVLLCPEDMTQISVTKHMLFDPLPADVKPLVTWRDNYWLPDEALSVYVRSAGLFGSEMHSPIMAIGSGIPAIVCRFEEQTSKGYMWRDIGLDQWLFDLDKAEQVSKVPETVMEMANDLNASKALAAEALENVKRYQRQSMELVKANIT